MLTPAGYPPPQHSSRHGPQRTQHTASTAATPRYPKGRRQYPCRRAGPTQSVYARERVGGLTLSPKPRPLQDRFGQIGAGYVVASLGLSLTPGLTRGRVRVGVGRGGGGRGEP